MFAFCFGGSHRLQYPTALAKKQSNRMHGIQPEDTELIVI
jgi:hypothetical protein